MRVYWPLVFAAVCICCLAASFARGASPTPSLSLVYGFQGLTQCSTTPLTCDGFGPAGGLIIDGDFLYGTTSGGGGNQSGTLFSISLANDYDYQILHPFGSALQTGGADGASPQAALTLVRGATLADDIIYGTTYAGGDARLGTVFSYQPSSKTYTVLHSFVGSDPAVAGLAADGANPLGPVTYFKGALYGTTAIGGKPHGGAGCFDNNGCGTVYRIDLATGEEKILWAFQGSFPTEKGVLPDGSNPQGGLTVLDGVLYGTTSGGGGYGCFAAEGCGTVFQIGLDGGNYTVLHRFCSSVGSGGTTPAPGQFCKTDGAYPSGSLTPEKSSSTAPLLLYGATAQGGGGDCGIDGCGTIFSIAPASATAPATVQTVFSKFRSGMTGAVPEGNLTPDYSHRGIFTDYSHRGSFLGAALAGGTGVFNSSGQIDAATDGNPCNTPNIAGAAGTIYELLLATSSGSTPAVKPLFNFNGVGYSFTGAQPDGNLVRYTTPDGQIQFYGTTYAGGNCQSGTVFVIQSAGKAASAATQP